MQIGKPRNSHVGVPLDEQTKLKPWVQEAIEEELQNGILSSQNPLTISLPLLQTGSPRVHIGVVFSGHVKNWSFGHTGVFALQNGVD